MMTDSFSNLNRASDMTCCFSDLWQTFRQNCKRYYEVWINQRFSLLQVKCLSADLMYTEQWCELDREKVSADNLTELIAFLSVRSGLLFSFSYWSFVNKTEILNFPSALRSECIYLSSFILLSAVITILSLKHSKQSKQHFSLFFSSDKYISSIFILQIKGKWVKLRWSGNLIYLFKVKTRQDKTRYVS